ncbi:substrate-binding periplasmic protein [Pseudoduganella sp. R-43]|uniref:substrate-binding periplasmic protein n=1 Tax=Pseudoduganella sp. R-43 TaxID=3404063 RepID=UPI003CF1D795
MLRLLVLSCLLLSAPCAGCGELVVLVDRAADMPMARIDNGRLADGVHKMLGEALARGTGRELRFLLLPRKRIARALQQGEADILCGYTPEWIEGDYLWTEPVFTAEEVLVTDARHPQPHSIADLRGQAIGTILATSILKSKRFSVPALYGTIRPIWKPISRNWRAAGCTMC